MVVERHAHGCRHTARADFVAAGACACAGTAGLTLLGPLLRVVGVIHVDCASSSCGDNGGLGLVECKGVCWFRAATEFDHHGAEDDGHAFCGLVCCSHVCQGCRQALEILHVVVAIVGVLDECERGN